VHASVATAQPHFWRRLFAFSGPAYLVSVGYMDPGNWATDLEGGARFGYQLLWVLAMSNLMALLLQTLSARLGIVARRDLAQACREAYPRPVSRILWVLCEIAIAACDLAEVLGAAIALNMLFGLPVIAGVILTAFDTFLVLYLMRFGIRYLEAFVIMLVTVIGACFVVEILLARPSLGAMAAGLIPRLSDESLYVAIAMLGATVMPHNLYLHSALVQTRQLGRSEQDTRDACKFNLIDSFTALNGALFVNASLLILAAAVFYERGIVVTELQQAQQMLSPLLGTTMAGILFAVALLCSGQSSTLTGTMAGQIVMEGFLNFRMRPWLRRLITRMVAVVPAVIVLSITGEQGTFKLLVLSQVILSLQLPFAVIPLIHFTSDAKWMRGFANPAWLKLSSAIVAIIIVLLNVRLATNSISEWLHSTSNSVFWFGVVVAPVSLLLLLLLLWVSFEPWLPARLRAVALRGVETGREYQAVAQVPRYSKILVPLDHTDMDRETLAHAASMAGTYGSELHLLHVEEGVIIQLYGQQSSTRDIVEGQRYFRQIVEDLTGQSLHPHLHFRYSNNPAQEIIHTARELKPDLLIMGAHGHKGLKDLVLGQTINAVRHGLDIPILIVTRER
jgi:manganese transport protein